MKTLLTVFAVLFAASAQAELTTYVCREKVPTEHRDILVRQGVVITENRELPRGNDDYRAAVTVELQKFWYTGRVMTSESFEAIATSEGVMYEVKTESGDFEFTIFLDELDQSFMIRRDRQGNEYRVSFVCR